MAKDRVRRSAQSNSGPQRNISGVFGDINNDYIEESVKNAYRIVEPWMKQGQRMAQQLGQNAYGPLMLPDSTRDLQGRWLQISGEMVATWFDMMGAASDWVMPGLMPGNSDDSNDRKSHKDRSSSREKISSHDFMISGHQPARVKIKLGPIDANCRLRAKGFGKGIKVRFRARSNRLMVRVKISEEAESGSYKGKIVDRDYGDVLGRIRIEVG